MLVRKLLYLSVYSVPDREIRTLLTQEKKLLELLKVDSLQDGSLWFEGLCTLKSGPTRLLISGHDLGHPVQATSIQTGLDFNERERELFPTADMGVDVLRELKRYADVLDRISERVRRERPAVEAAMKWSRRTIP